MGIRDHTIRIREDDHDILEFIRDKDGYDSLADVVRDIIDSFIKPDEDED